MLVITVPAMIAVLFHSRLTRPLLGMVLVVMGLSVILRDQTRNVIISSGMCLVLCSIFFAGLYTCKMLGDSEYIAPALAADGGTLNPEERKFLIEQMEISKKAFLSSLAGISEAQWSFKPAPDRWSIAECMEHIAAAEDFILGNIQEGVMKAPAAPGRDVAAIAETHFREAARAMEQCSHRAMRPAAVMSALYRATLSALQRSGWRNPMARVSVATSLKLWLVLRHGLL